LPGPSGHRHVREPEASEPEQDASEEAAPEEAAPEEAPPEEAPPEEAAGREWPGSDFEEYSCGDEAVVPLAELGLKARADAREGSAAAGASGSSGAAREGERVVLAEPRPGGVGARAGRESSAGGGAEGEDGRAPQLERLALDGDYYSDGGIEPSEEEEAPGAVQRRERKVTRHTHATGRFFAGCINSAQHVKCCICSGLRPRDPNASTPPLLAQIDYSRFDGLSVSDSEQPEEVCLLACRPAACPCIACGQPLQTFHMLA
jgi:hypothetical protein